MRLRGRVCRCCGRGMCAPFASGVKCWFGCGVGRVGRLPRSHGVGRNCTFGLQTRARTHPPTHVCVQERAACNSALHGISHGAQLKPPITTIRIHTTTIDDCPSGSHLACARTPPPPSPTQAGGSLFANPARMYTSFSAFEVATAPGSAGNQQHKHARVHRHHTSVHNCRSTQHSCLSLWFHQPTTTHAIFAMQHRHEEPIPTAQSDIASRTCCSVRLRNQTIDVRRYVVSFATVTCWLLFHFFLSRVCKTHFLSITPLQNHHASSCL